MAMERTLLICKPDAYARRLVGRVVNRFEEKGLRIVGMKMMVISKELASEHYAEHKEKSIFPGLIDFITSGPVVVFVAEGLNAVEVCRTVIGATHGGKAAPGTLRGDFGMSISNNLVHGSDSVASAEREVGLFFTTEELLPEDLSAHTWIYNLERME